MDKYNIVSKLIGVFWVLMLLFSCNKKEYENDVLEILKKEYNKPKCKNINPSLESNGGYLLEREGGFMNCIANCNSQNAIDINRFSNERKRGIDYLIFNGFATYKVINEETIRNNKKEIINSVLWEISLTEKCSPYIVGPTTEGWVINIWDYDDFKLVDKLKIVGDTIFAKYKIGKYTKTPLFEILRDEEKAVTDTYINNPIPHEAKFLISGEKIIPIKIGSYCELFD